MQVTISVLLAFSGFLHCFNCLIVKIDVETILKRPIKTSVIAGVIKHFLSEGEYGSVAKLLQFTTFDFNPAYYSIFDKASNHFILNMLLCRGNGEISKEESRLLLPSNLVYKRISLERINAADVAVHPFSGEIYSLPNCFKDDALVAAIQWGLQDRDHEMNWNLLPPYAPFHYNKVWVESDFWKTFTLNSFREAHIAIKRKMVSSLIKVAERFQLSSDFSISTLLMINITSVAFFFEILNLVEVDRSQSVIDLKNDIGNLLDIIKNISLARENIELFKGLNLISSNIIFASSESLRSNPFYYEDRIELFSNILTRLKGSSDVFADWFINLLASFYDVIDKMSLKLLSDLWNTYLSFKPTIHSFAIVISWFKTKVREEYRVKLAKLIPQEFLILFYRKCPRNYIPSLYSLIPFSLRRSEYLKYNRIGTETDFGYDLVNFWSPNQSDLGKLLKVFQYIYSGFMDLFESIDIYFLIEPFGKEIGLVKFIEIILKLFFNIKEWHIELQPSQNEEAHYLPVILPSPLFPPSFGPILAKLMIRCRHLNCSSPFKISQSFLLLSLEVSSSETPGRLVKLVQAHMKYLKETNGKRIPKLTSSYKLYFSMIITFKDQIESDLEDLSKDHDSEIFFNHHLSLYRAIRHLRRESKSKSDLELNSEQVSQLEAQLYEISLLTLNSFGTEFNSLIGGKEYFHRNEIHSFLYD